MLNLPKTSLICLALLGLTLWAAPAGARVTVTFPHPETYADADLRGAPVLPVIRAHLEQLGASYLGRDAVLRITVLDMRLAGRYEPLRSPSGPRFMRDGTWPTITLRYTLSQGGKVIASGKETISDQFYLTRGRTVSSGQLTYEKAMLDDWFRERFAPQR